MVPTVERGFCGLLWSIDTAGERLPNEVYVGLVDLAQEHTRIGGQRFLNVAALTLRKDGVEGEGGLTG